MMEGGFVCSYLACSFPPIQHSLGKDLFLGDCLGYHPCLHCPPESSLGLLHCLQLLCYLRLLLFLVSHDLDTLEECWSTIL